LYLQRKDDLSLMMNGLMIPLQSRALAAGLALSVSEPCIATDFVVPIHGVLKEGVDCDRRTGKLHSYFIIGSSEYYGLIGENVDERSSTPTARTPYPFLGLTESDSLSRKVSDPMPIKLMKLLFNLASRAIGYGAVVESSHSRWFYEHQRHRD
jgi:hypothetical protein